MSKTDLIQSFLESAELGDVLDKVTALNLQRSADLCVETILYTRRQIDQGDTKKYLLQDIEDCIESYRQLAYCYNYYTGEHLPTIEERLKEKE
jgi:hypothetical protein